MKKYIIGGVIVCLLAGIGYVSYDLVNASRERKIEEETQEKVNKNNQSDYNNMSDEELNEILYETDTTGTYEVEFKEYDNEYDMVAQQGIMFIADTFPMYDVNKIEYNVTKVDDTHYLVDMGDWCVSVVDSDGYIYPYESFKKSEPTEEEMRYMMSSNPNTVVEEKNGVYVWGTKE